MTYVIAPVRGWLRLEGLAVLGSSMMLYHAIGGSWFWFWVLLLVPDISLAGYAGGPRIGAIVYNVVHSYLLPLIGLTICVATGASRWTPYLLIWTAHNGMDRAAGFGLKYPDAFASTHLGPIGKATKSATV